jgi:hypothetical protein
MPLFYVYLKIRLDSRPSLDFNGVRFQRHANPKFAFDCYHDFQVCRRSTN